MLASLVKVCGPALFILFEDRSIGRISLCPGEEKVGILRKLREERYEQLKDAVYERRGWTNDGIPTLDTVRRLGIDLPDVLEVLKAHGVA